MASQFEKESFKKKFIELEKIIASKNPRLLKVLPRFILNYVKRVIHEKEINEFIDQYGEQNGLDFCAAVLKHFHIHTRINGMENLPQSGGCIVAANHPLGGLDAIALMNEIGKRRIDFKFLVNDILMNLTNLKDLFVAVNKHGKNSTTLLEMMNKTYASDQAILVFPAGLVSRKQKGGVLDLEWKKSFITQAKKYEKDIVPVHIAGRNSEFFYGLAQWRKRIGIKANLEMFYLVDELFKARGKTIHITIGKPISYMWLNKSKSDKEWAEQIKAHVYKIGKEGNHELEFLI